MGKEKIIAELKATIAETGVTLSDIFTPEEIKSSDVFKKESVNAHEHARRIERVLGEEREKIINLTKSLEEKDTKIKGLNEVVSKTQVKTLFDNAKTARKFNEKEKVFIEKRINDFKSDKDGEALKLDFDKFLDAQVNDYIETAKLLGVPIEDKNKENSTGVENADGKNSNIDLTDPKQNDFIPA